MMTSGLSLILIAALLLPMAVLPAAAQTPASPPVQAPAPPPAQAQPAPPVTPETQIDTSRVPYQHIEVTNVHRAGAAALNIVYVPGKAITCGAGIVVASVL